MRTAIVMPQNRYPNAVFFERAAFAAAAAALNIDGTQSAELFAKRRWQDDKVTALLNRSPVDPAKTSVSGWAAEIVNSAYRQFLASLHPVSAASRLIALGVQASLAGAGDAKYPARNGDPVVVGWVGQGGAIPVGARQFQSITLGPAKKIALISVMTHELMKRADAELAFATLLREDAALTLDSAYFSTSAGSAIAHAGLLYGLTPIPASAQGGDASVKNDLSALAETVSAGGSGQVLFVVSTKRASSFAINFPEIAANVTLIASPAVPDGRVIGVDPLAIVHAVDGDPDIAAGEHATLHMESSPTNLSAAGSPNTVAAPIMSMFQTGQIALRVLSDMAFAKRTANAVAYIDDADWTAVTA